MTSPVLVTREVAILVVVVNEVTIVEVVIVEVASGTKTVLVVVTDEVKVLVIVLVGRVVAVVEIQPGGLMVRVVTVLIISTHLTKLGYIAGEKKADSLLRFMEKSFWISKRRPRLFFLGTYPGA